MPAAMTRTSPPPPSSSRRDNTLGYAGARMWSRSHAIVAAISLSAGIVIGAGPRVLAGVAQANAPKIAPQKAPTTGPSDDSNDSHDSNDSDGAQGPKGSTPANAPPGHSRLEKLDQFARALAIIERLYVRPVSGDDLMDGALRGMVAQLDPHSRYMAPQEAKMLQQDLDGRFGGVGLIVTLDRDERGAVTLMVREVIEGGPAANAGVQVGDHISEIEGKPVGAYLDLLDAVGAMRGEIGTSVRFVVQREGEEPRSLTVERQTVVAAAVVTQDLGSGLAVLRLRDFQSGCARDIKKVIEELERKHKDKGGLRGIVLDLRDNGGGLLVEAIELVDLFVSQGVIVRTRGRGEAEVDVFRAQPGGTIADLPLVVLMNKGSASASEIVAGALQDHDRAVLVGERSYGKGSVQTPYSLGQGSVLKITTALYYTPDDRLIQASGVEPDIAIGTAARTETDSRSDLIAERDVPGHLDPADFKVQAADASLRTKILAELEKDPQLAGAVEVLLAISPDGAMKGRVKKRGRSR